MGRTCQGQSRGIRPNWCGLIERRGYRMTCHFHGCFFSNVLSNSFFGSTKGWTGLLQGPVCRLLHVSAANHPLGRIGWRWPPGNGGLVIKGPMAERAADPARSSMSDCRLCPPGLEGCHLCCKTGPHRYIPQRPYAPKQGAWDSGAFTPMKITFRKAGQCGILVRDAISKDFRDLEGRDLRPFRDVGIAAQATLRIEVSS